MLAAILTLIGTMSALAQIDPQVTEIMRKCEKVMSNPAGLEMTMTIEARMVIKLTGMTATVAMKDEKSKASIVMKVLGKEVRTEEGFDGTQEWNYRHIDLKKKGKEVKDTLTIKKTGKKSESDYDIDFDMDVNDNAKVYQKIIQKYTTSTECCKGTKSLLYITYC